MWSRFRYSSVMNHVLSLAAGLTRQGVRAVVVISDCPRPYREQLHYYRQQFPCFAESRPDEIVRLARHYRFDLLHLHDLSLAGKAQKLIRTLRIPCGATLHERLDLRENPTPLQNLSFLITPRPEATSIPVGPGQKAIFIPEGVDLEACRPATKEGFKITVMGEEGGLTGEGTSALLKAAGLADLEVELVSPGPFPLIKGRYYGWRLNSSAVLAGSQIVVGRRRSLLEGMACGNAALIMGQSYHGIFDPSTYPAALSFPDLSGAEAEPPCYRTIFYDLSTLLKNRPFLKSLQQQGRKFVRENCDLRLVAERTHLIYRRIAEK